jgi:hypothetical protein
MTVKTGRVWVGKNDMVVSKSDIVGIAQGLMEAGNTFGASALMTMVEEAGGLPATVANGAAHETFKERKAREVAERKVVRIAAKAAKAQVKADAAAARAAKAADAATLAEAEASAAAAADGNLASPEDVTEVVVVA